MSNHKWNVFGYCNNKFGCVQHNVMQVQSSSRFRKANSSLWALHPHIGLSCFTVWNNVANQINTLHFSLAICYKIDSLPLKAYNLYYAYNPCQYTNHTFKIRLQNGEPTKTTNLVTSSNKQVITCNVLCLDSSPPCSKSNYSYEHSHWKPTACKWLECTQKAKQKLKI